MDDRALFHQDKNGLIKEAIRRGNRVWELEEHLRRTLLDLEAWRATEEREESSEVIKQGWELLRGDV